MSANINKIVLLGKSEKFIDIVHSLFDKAEILTIPWRDCLYCIGLTKDFSPDLIVVCGYDYASSFYEYKDYIDVNVTRPLQVIDTLSHSSTKIIYVDTEHSTKSITFSRYRYAKNLLAKRLLSGFNDVSVLSIPTVKNDEGRADIQGGLITKLIFNFFINIGFVKTISSEKLQQMFFDTYKSKTHSSVNTLIPRFLDIRRTLFLDRMLRFVSG